MEGAQRHFVKKLCTLEEVVKDGVHINNVSLGDPGVLRAGEIEVDQDLALRLHSSAEIRLSVAKRLKGGLKFSTSITYLDIFCWCLSTRSYEFSSKNIKGVTDEEIERVWEHADTVSISSTELCRDLVSDCKGQRSAVGFSRIQRREPRERPCPTKVFDGISPPILCDYGGSDTVGYGSFEELGAYQCAEFVFKSSSPLHAASHMLSAVRKKNQRVEKSPVHR